MTDKTQAEAHAEITAPISADLRGIEGASPVSHAVRLLREAAAELKNWHTIGGDWGDEIEALDAYNEHTAVAATLEQAEAGQAVPAPVTYMATDNACKWAWDQVREDVGAEGWTAGDSGTFHGFFLWGWNYRGQYETQRPAVPPAPAAVAVLTTQQIIDRFDFLEGAVTESTYRRIVETAQSIQLAAAPAQAVAVPSKALPYEPTSDMLIAAREHDPALPIETIRAIYWSMWRTAPAAPAQEHATQLAGPGQHPDDVAVHALAAAMKAKLARQRAKGYSGWNTEECTQQRLSDMLRAHVGKGDPVDVANFCAFLGARGEGIAPAADGGMAGEYQRWIDFFHKGDGDYDDFLRIDAARAAQGGAA